MSERVRLGYGSRLPAQVLSLDCVVLKIVVKILPLSVTKS